MYNLGVKSVKPSRPSVVLTSTCGSRTVQGWAGLPTNSAGGRHIRGGGIPPWYQEGSIPSMIPSHSPKEWPSLCASFSLFLPKVDPHYAPHSLLFSQRWTLPMRHILSFSPKGGPSHTLRYTRYHTLRYTRYHPLGTPCCTCLPWYTLLYMPPMVHPMVHLYMLPCV